MINALNKNTIYTRKYIEKKTTMEDLFVELAETETKEDRYTYFRRMYSCNVRKR